jgi:trehalose synthase
MTSIAIEQVDPPTSARGLRALDAARERAADGLAGRTVWCATALPSHRDFAQLLRACLQWGGGGGVSCVLLEVQAGDELRDVCEQLDSMLEGGSPGPLGDAEREICAAGVGVSEELVRSVGPDDVVVVHDPVTALLAQALRDRGTHAVWHIQAAAPRPGPTADAARAFLRRWTDGIDAYAWSQPSDRGATAERIAALMPSADLVAGREIPAAFASGEHRLVGWSSVLADIVQADRDETVGGRLHARPVVPVR